ncbi:helix-turn-helix domain-containing protein [Sphingobacterium puteale]|uniref:helix-turn-helix domain-containing protein n=1 Tax=Sphingobacterium puteale TaxID=2420510 RepID=UPI003D9A0827
MLRTKIKPTIRKIASHFGISKNYFDEYFKQQTGTSSLDYRLAYRLKLVETYLRYSSTRLGESPTNWSSVTKTIFQNY